MAQKKLLLIESDDFYVEIIGTFVKLFLQHDLLAVKTAAEAIDPVRSGSPDLVLLDLDNGTLEALEFAERMRDDAATKRVPILALCQSDLRREEALGRGCSAFLAKPFKVRELETLIQKLLTLP